jgi:hypothetical protein
LSWKRLARFLPTKIIEKLKGLHMNQKIIIRNIIFAVGIGIGAAIYQYFTYANQEINIPKTLFIMVFSFVYLSIVAFIRAKKK